jgi:hypothetical protein
MSEARLKRIQSGCLRARARLPTRTSDWAEPGRSTRWTTSFSGSLYWRNPLSGLTGAVPEIGFHLLKIGSTRAWASAGVTSPERIRKLLFER